jgi:HAD superfamily hydrolase (TIGR01509 family)
MIPPQPPLKAAVFDLDGLIANTEDVYELAGNELLRRRGKEYGADLREQMMGRPVAESLKVMIEWHALTDTLDDLTVESRHLVYQFMESALQPMPGLMHLLDELDAAGLPKAIATSGTKEYVERVFKQLGLTGRFDFILTSEDVLAGKPAPDVYLLAAKQLGLPPAEVLVLEDSANGCRAAVAAGAYAVAVPNRHTQDHDFTGTQFVADTLADPRIRIALQLAT